MARTVADAHLLLRAQLGDDKRSAHSDNCRIPVELTGADLAKVRVAVSADLGCAPVDHNIAGVFNRRVAHFRHAFKEVQESAPDFGNVHEVFEILRGVDYVAAHGERLQKSRDLLDRNVIDNTERGLEFSLRRCQSGAGCASRAPQAVSCVLQGGRRADLSSGVRLAVSAFELFVEEINGKRMPTYMRWLALAYAPTMALACAAALPCGVDHLGLPFGIQVIGPNGSDARVLQIAHALEQVLSQNEATRRPLPNIDQLAALNSRN